MLVGIFPFLHCSGFFLRHWWNLLSCCFFLQICWDLCSRQSYGYLTSYGRLMKFFRLTPPKSQVSSVSVGPQTISSVIVQQETIPSSSTTAVLRWNRPVRQWLPKKCHLPYPQGDCASPSDSYLTLLPVQSMQLCVYDRYPSLNYPAPVSLFSSISFSADSMSYFGGHALPSIIKKI